MKVVRNPNGFLVVTIWAKPDGSAHRMHVWDEPGADGDIHQHRADFTSRIIEGVLAEEICEIGEDDTGGWDHLRADCWSEDSGRYHVDVESSVRCEPILVRTEHHRAGETYTRDARDLHRAIAVKVPLVTMVTFGPVYQQVHSIIRRRS